MKQFDTLSQSDKWLLIYGTGKAECVDESKTVFPLYVEFLCLFKAPPTRLRRFLKTYLFLSVLG